MSLITLIPSLLSMVGSAFCTCLPNETKVGLFFFHVRGLHLVQCRDNSVLRVETACELSCE